ncbi:MAG: DUF3592 domain-containing protein [Proteobacteria bacterium]|nr:MAG: DUF3592 domain-containing protein [Pseudomonadota bacterium]
MALVQFKGPLVPTEIVDRYTRNDSDSDGYLHYVVYRVPVAGVAPFATEMVDEASYNATTVGSKVPLQISPLFPGRDSVLRIPGRDTTGILWGSGFGSVVMLGMGALIVYYIYILPNKTRGLIKRGIPVVGRLVDKSHSNHESIAYYLHYEYHPDGGGEPIHSKQSVRDSDYNEQQIGDLFTVIHDRKNPKFSVIYRYGDYDVIG